MIFLIMKYAGYYVTIIWINTVVNFAKWGYWLTFDFIASETIYIEYTI